MSTNNVVRFQTFEQFHNKAGVGSTRIRVHNLIKNWNEAELYKYGEKADVMIFQKVYSTYDYTLPLTYPGIKILDTCDPDWTHSPDIYIAKTCRAMDAVVVPTKAMQKFLKQLTDKPVKVIKDRFDMTEFPKPKRHKGKLKTIAWFGYAHNAELLKFAVPSFEKRGMRLLVISNEDPMAYKWATKPQEYVKMYDYIKYYHDTIYIDLQQADVCIMPKGYRPQDAFKSENKTVIAQLCGLPVVTNSDELDDMINPEARDLQIASVYDTLRKEYDCIKSVEEYKELIKSVRSQ